MKKIITIILIVFCTSLASFAQDQELKFKGNDTLFTKVTSAFSARTYKGERAIKEYQKYKKNGKRWRWDGGHWQGATLTYGGLVDGLGNLNKPQGAEWMTQGTSSIGLDLNFIDLTIFSRGCFGIFSGLGLEINNFRFDKNVAIGNDENGYIVPDWSYDKSGVALSKTKLTTTYLQVPLMFEFQFGKNRSGWINFGVVGGFLVDGHTKIKQRDGGTVKRYSGLNLNNFHYGFEASIGYTAFGLRAKYYPQSIFRDGLGPNTQQVNIGITIAL